MENLHQNQQPEDPMEQNDPVSPTPNTPPAPTSQKKTKSRKRKIFIGLILVVITILLLGGGTASAAYLIAYGKINIKNAPLQREISMFVQDLPFLPKTTEYLITKTYSAQQTVDSAYLEASLAFSANELAQYLGTGDLDL